MTKTDPNDRDCCVTDGGLDTALVTAVAANAGKTEQPEQDQSKHPQWS